MSSESIKCQNCGAPITNPSGAESFVCSYCGSLNKIIKDDSAYHTVIINETNPSVQSESLLRRAFLFLEDSHIFEANEYFDKVLDLCPEEYRAYLGKLMIELSVKTEEDIPKCNVDLNKFDTYHKLLRFAPEDKRAVYEEYNQIILERFHQQELKKQQIALEKQKKTEAMTAKAKKIGIIAVIACAVIFGISMAVINIHKEVSYNNGIKESQAGDNEKAVEAFDAAGLDYKDTKEKVRQPAYQIANRLYMTHDYLSAAAYYIKANGYKDSTQKLRSINSSISPIFNIGGADTAIIQKDGSVYVPYCRNPSDTKIKQVQSWHDIVSLISDENFVLALKKDGSIVTAGSNSYWDPQKASGFINIVKIYYDFTSFYGLTSNGDIVSQNDSYRITSWHNIVDLKFYDDIYALGLKKDGTVVYSDDDVDVSSWKNIKAIAIGDSYILGLKNDGTVVAAGYDNYDNCNVSSWKDIIQIDSDNDTTYGLKSDGTVMVAGNTNMSVKKEVSSWKDIISIKTRYKCLYGLKSDGTMLYAGDDLSLKNALAKLKNIVYFDIHYNSSLYNDNFIALQADGKLIMSGFGFQALYNVDASNIAISPPK